MKFEYDGKSDDRECVAFIDEDGDLVMKDYLGGAITIFAYGMTESGYDWKPDTAIHKFYTGDKITITF